jgi:DNA-binding transcriptional LysR family regulator
MLNLTVVNRAQVIRRLSDNRDDLVVMSMVPQDMGLEFLPFLNNPIVAVARPDHPLATAKSRAQGSGTQTLVIREPGSGTRKACEEYFKEKRIHFEQTLEVSSAEAQRECVVGGLGVALLTRHALSLELATGTLVELPVAELPLLRSWCVVQAGPNVCRRWLTPSWRSSAPSGRRSASWSRALTGTFRNVRSARS